MTCLLQADDVAAPGESQPGHVAGVGGALVAKQHAGRKPKGLRKRDEQSERCVCERERERMEAGLQIRAASVVIIRCCRNSRRLLLFTAASCRSLPPSFSPSSAVYLSDVYI